MKGGLGSKLKYVPSFTLVILIAIGTDLFSHLLSHPIFMICGKDKDSLIEQMDHLVEPLP